MNAEGDRDLVERWFAGDLDRVETNTLRHRLETDASFREAFDAAYDARTARDPWAGIATESLELEDCFSPVTLERFVDGELDVADRDLVAAHLDCSWCSGQIEAIRADKERVPDAPAPPMPAPSQRPRSRGWWAALPVAATAAAAVLLVFGPRIIPPPDPRFSIEVVSASAEQFRSTLAQVGDQLDLAIEQVAGRSAAVRVYLRDVGLVLHCPAQPADSTPKRCVADERALRASLELEARGTYEIVLLVSEEPIPDPTGDVDGDIAAAPEGTIRFDTVEVR